jgi:peptide/nickel transport system ATP-binding protein
MLVSSAPVPDPLAQADRRAARRLIVKDAADDARRQSNTGCPFAPRCAFAADVCRDTRPALLEIGHGRTVACHLFDPDAKHPQSREGAFT